MLFPRLTFSFSSSENVTWPFYLCFNLSEVFISYLCKVPSCGFLDEKFGNESGYNTPQKEKTFDMGTNSPDILKSGIYERASYAFEDQLPKKRLFTVFQELFLLVSLPK